MRSICQVGCQPNCCLSCMATHCKYLVDEHKIERVPCPCCS